MADKITYPECGVCEMIPRIDPALVIIDSPSWSANLRDSDQTLLGTTFVTLKDHISELDQLTTAQDEEFFIIRNALIRSIRASFHPLTINLSCLKNDAFKQAPDSTPTEAAHVHWHLKPRYTSNPIIVNGEEFTDPLPGKYLSVYDRLRPSKETALLIAATLRSNLPQGFDSMSFLP
jgi:diadenosine tetraphosphate (Ap4A) HIT family hydrolase